MDYNVAVLLATYNGEKFLEEQLSSILNQTYSKFKIFIHDDGSSDNTMEIIKCFKKKFPDKLVIFHGKACHGAKNNFMYLLNSISSYKTKFDYYFFADQDDIWIPNKLELLVNSICTIDANVPALVFSDMEVVDQQKNTIAKSFIQYARINTNELFWQRILISNPVAGCSSVINEALRKLIIQLEQIEHIDMHDHWFALVAAYTGVIRYIDSPLVYYRIHGKNTVGVENHEFLCWLIKKIKKETLYSQICQTKNNIQNNKNMAIELYKVNYESNQKEILADFINIENNNKIEKIIFYLKNGFIKNERNWWMLIWV